MHQKFKEAISPLLHDESKLAVAVSGGSDSMALALLLAELAAKSDIQIIAITVDHALRKESASEAVQVGKWMKVCGIEHHILEWTGDKKPSNIQANARKARYRLMADFCATQNIKTLCVGHTSNDQAETVLMRLMRGSGVDGLAAISLSSKVFGIRIIRPLLDFTREELREYLREHKQEWVEDPSNNNTKYTRVQIRKLINSVENPALLTKRLSATASHMARAKNYMEEKIRQSLEGVFTFHEEGFYTINLSKFKQLHEEERLRALVSALQHIGGKDYKTRFKKLEALDKRIMAIEPFKACTLWGCTITASKKQGEENLLFIYREPDAVAAQIDISDNKKIKWDGRFICTIQNIDISGLKLGALTKNGYETLTRSGLDTESLQKKNNFIMPKKVIYSLPALWVLEKLLAVPHIGYYADNRVKDLFFSKAKSPPNILRKA